MGAGAIASHLSGRLAPEAQAAVAAYRSVQSTLLEALQQCSSGRELIEKGFEHDVAVAAQLNVSDCVPKLVDNAYLRWCSSQ